jgi:recombination protein RecA
MILSNRPDGGWPCGRIVEVFGRESIGKSTLGYVAMANCQKAGGIAIYIDVEGTGNKVFMQMLGIDLDKMITIEGEPIIEKLFPAIQESLYAISVDPAMKDRPVMIVVDSVTAMQTNAESEAGYDYNMNAALMKAKQLGNALKKIVPFLIDANACLYFVNQVRDNTTGYGESYVVPGGKALPFYASIRLYLESKTKVTVTDEVLEREYEAAMEAYKAAGGKKAGLEKPEKPKVNKENETIVGSEVTAFTKKNKTAPGEKRAKFRIIYSQGLQDEKCWFDPCLKYGIVEKVGNFYEIAAFENEIGKFNKDKWESVLLSDKNVYEQVKKMMVEKLTVSLHLDNANFNLVEAEDDDVNDYNVKSEED